MSIYPFRTDLAGEIRRFFLLPRESYSLADLAGAWRISLDDVAAIFADELDAAGVHRADAAGFQVAWAHAVGAAASFHIFRPYDVEIALGDDFERVRGSRWRTVPVLVQLPRCIVDALLLLDFFPPSDSISARAERLLSETVEAELVLRGTTRPTSR